MNNDCFFSGVQNVPKENVENLQTAPHPKRDETDFLHFPQRKKSTALWRRTTVWVKVIADKSSKGFIPFGVGLTSVYALSWV